MFFKNIIKFNYPMEFKTFIRLVENSIKNKRHDKTLTSYENKFNRSALLNKLIVTLSNILNTLKFNNDIIFTKNGPFVIVEGIRLYSQPIYLKNSNNEYESSALKTINLLKSFNIPMKTLIDIGSCWGEYSLVFAKYFSECKIYSVEGSSKNYKFLCLNLDSNKILKKNIIPSNLIISNKNGYEQIQLGIGTMNKIKEKNDDSNGLYENVKSKKLYSFVKDNEIGNIDFIKIDIEGSEKNLLDDLLGLEISSIQVELINYNSIKQNVSFLKAFSKKYNFYDINNKNKIEAVNVEKYVQDIFKSANTLDVFLVSKKIDINL